MKDTVSPFLSVTEKSALAGLPFIGRGQAKAADAAAVDAMREAFNSLPMHIRIVIGEGERDKAPRLFSGEELGDPQSPVKRDAAVDPLEGTALCAGGKPGALSVIAAGPRGSLLKAPDIYMQKIACGPKGKGAVHLDAPPEENLKNLSKALGKPLKTLVVGVLDRPRHKTLIESIYKSGARVFLAEDGDVALALNSAFNSSPIDLLMGTGGAPEGVLAGAALKCLGGEFQGRLVFRNKTEEEKARKAGVKDLHKIWTIESHGESHRESHGKSNGESKEKLLFCASGLTSGDLLPGIKEGRDFYAVHSLILTEGGGLWNIRRRFPKKSSGKQQRTISRRAFDSSLPVRRQKSG